VTAGQLCAGGCGQTLTHRQGRHPGADWWCDRPLCRSARAHRRYLASANGRGRARRVRGTCDRCHGDYYPTPGRRSPYRLCARPDCQRERARRAAQARRHAARGVS
jgi:hypothetical protein